MRASSVVTAFAIILFYLVCTSLVYYLHGKRDYNVDEDIPFKGRNLSLLRVKRYLLGITDFGSRMFTSVANKLAGQYIYNTLDNLIKKKIEGSAFTSHLEMFHSNGSYTIRIVRRLSHTHFVNSPVIVLTLVAREPVNSTCIVNSHYDSVIGTVGAADNAFSVAITIELANFFMSLTADEIKPKCNLVFLFNGGEEAIMSAIQGFVSNHKVVPQISAIINMDSSGAGGRGFLFRSSSKCSHLIETYAKSVPEPFFNVIAEEVFNLDILPVDTDFSVFKIFGSLQGVDIALIGNAHHYHNMYDNPSFLTDNILWTETRNHVNFIFELVASDSLNKPGDHNKDQQLVYFDFLHLFTISYSASVGIIQNYLCVLVASLFVWIRIRKRLKYDFYRLCKMFALVEGSLLLSVLATLIFNVLQSIFLTVVGAQLFWYTYYRVLWVIYGIPCIFVFVGTYMYLVKVIFKTSMPFDDDTKDALLTSSFMILNIFVLAVLNFLHIRSAYICSLILITLVLQSIIKDFISKCQYKAFVTRMMFLLSTVPISGIYTLYAVYLSFIFAESVLGVFDRFPCAVPAETIVAISTTFVFIGTIIPLLTNMFTLKSSMAVLKNITLLLWGIVLIMIVLGVIPKYSVPHGPKRATIMDLHHRKFDEDFKIKEQYALLVLLATDQQCMNGYGKFIKSRFTKMKGVYSNYFSVHPLAVLPGFDSSLFYMKTSESATNMSDIELKVLMRQSYNGKSNISFALIGNGILSLDLIMNERVNLLNWSFKLDMVPVIQLLDGRIVYNHLLFIDKLEEPFLFWLQVSREVESFFDISFVKHNMDAEVSENMSKLLRLFPKWVAPVSSTGKWNDYKVRN